MYKNSKLKIFFGVILVIASPIVFIYLPFLLQPLICDPHNNEWFHCAIITHATSLPIAIVSLVGGIILFVIGVRTPKR